MPNMPVLRAALEQVRTDPSWNQEDWRHCFGAFVLRLSGEEPNDYIERGEPTEDEDDALFRAFMKASGLNTDLALTVVYAGNTVKYLEYALDAIEMNLPLASIFQIQRPAQLRGIMPMVSA
jgi:hypothetical protein